MIAVDLNQIATIDAEEAGILVGTFAEDFAEAGTYYVVIGSRGEVEEIEFLGDVDSIEVPSLEEVLAKAEDQDERDYYEEFYGLCIEDDQVNFGYVEEGYNVWLKVA